MVLASHYVLDELLEAPKDEFESKFKIVVERYPDDAELLSLFEGFEEKDLEKVSEYIREISELRKLEESGGGSQLPYKDRRHL